MNCCSHLFEVSNVTPTSPNGCEECLKMSDSWLHLRLCVTCGFVGCCDESKNQHATKHFHSTNHPLIKSFEPDEEWGWCYVDELLLESVPGSLTAEWCGVLGATILTSSYGPQQIGFRHPQPLDIHQYGWTRKLSRVKSPR